MCMEAACRNSFFRFVSTGTIRSSLEGPSLRGHMLCLFVSPVRFAANDCCSRWKQGAAVLLSRPQLLRLRTDGTVAPEKKISKVLD